MSRKRKDFRLNAYTTATPTGVTVDVEGMLVDLVMLCKADGRAKEDFLAAQVWDETRVSLQLPGNIKN